MKYVLSKGTVLRQEWFGCLYYQTYTGCFRQFNEDAFEILRRLENPMTIEDMKNDLQSHGMDICKNELQEFISYYLDQGLITQQNEAAEITIFNNNTQPLRKDCLIAPSSVTLYSTDFCPKHCRHCATDSHPNINPSDELSLGNWIEVIHNLRKAGVISLVVSGGEPLAIPHTMQILREADELQFGLTLLTDYDNISKQQLADLKSLKHPLYIQTSLDGASPESHDFLRGNGSFSRTLRRLSLLKKANINFTVAVAVHKKNIGELDQIAELAHQYGASFVYLNAVAPYGRAKKTMKNFILNDDELKYMAQKCLHWTAEGKIKTRNPFWKSELNHLGENDYHPLSGTINAMSLGIYNFTINSKGDCYLDAKQRAEKFLLLGNILETDILTMWNDSRLDRLRSLHAQKKFTFAEQSEIEAIL